MGPTEPLNVFANTSALEAQVPKTVPPPEDSDWFDVTQAAEYLGQTIRWVRRRVENREITHHKIGGVRFHKDDLDAFIESRKKPALRAPRPIGRPRGR